MFSPKSINVIIKGRRAIAAELCDSSARTRALLDNIALVNAANWNLPLWRSTVDASPTLCCHRPFRSAAHQMLPLIVEASRPVAS